MKMRSMWVINYLVEKFKKLNLDCEEVGKRVGELVALGEITGEEANAILDKIEGKWEK